jgi:DNA-binding transcriptional ArsR family regulator
MSKQSATKEQLKARFAGNAALCHRVIGVLQLFSNKTRFRILCMLAEGDFCVNDMVEAIDLGKISNVSQQLKLLSLAGVVESRRDGQQVIYRLADARVRKLVAFLKRSYLEGGAEA